MNLEIGEDILTISANLLKIELYSGLDTLFLFLAIVNSFSIS